MPRRHKLAFARHQPTLRLTPRGQVLLNDTKGHSTHGPVSRQNHQLTPYPSPPKTIETYELEGTLKGPPVQLSCEEQGHLWVHLVAQGLVRPDPEYLQGWGTHHISGNPFQCFAPLIANSWATSHIESLFHMGHPAPSWQALFRGLYSPSAVCSPLSHGSCMPQTLPGYTNIETSKERKN